MPNGQQRAQEIVATFKTWMATMTRDDYIQIAHRGRLNQTEIIKALGFGRSAFLQNPELKKLLNELEENLHKEKILPPKQKKSVEKAEKYDQEAAKRTKDAQRLQTLEQRILELEAENKELRAKISRFSELSTVLADLGRLPE